MTLLPLRRLVPDVPEPPRTVTFGPDDGPLRRCVLEELYCGARDCDCRQVVLDVREPATGKVVARMDFYIRDPDTPERPELDPTERLERGDEPTEEELLEFQYQALWTNAGKLSPAESHQLLDAVSDHLEDERNSYERELWRHYRAFKAIVDDLDHPAQAWLRWVVRDDVDLLSDPVDGPRLDGRVMKREEALGEGPALEGREAALAGRSG